ncbi:MAG: hypothetical protein K2O44_06915 [Clostridia bacterium]|nr:hypothetical protein [Clostridia bacterium]
MNKVKKQFKDFWNFYRLTIYGNNQKETVKLFSFPTLIAFVVAFLANIHLGTSAAFGFVLVTSLIAVHVGRVTFDKTALISVAPFSPAQRVVFTYLTMLLNALFFFTAVSVCSAVVILILAFIDFCITGDSVIFKSSIWEQTFISPNAVGVAILSALIIFFAAIVLSHIDKTKIRNIATGVFFALNEALMLTVINIVGLSTQSGGVRRGFFLSIDLEMVDKLAHPWILLLVLGIIAAAVAGVSVWMVIKRHKSSKL